MFRLRVQRRKVPGYYVSNMANESSGGRPPSSGNRRPRPRIRGPHQTDGRLVRQGDARPAVYAPMPASSGSFRNRNAQHRQNPHRGFESDARTANAANRQFPVGPPPFNIAFPTATKILSDWSTGRTRSKAQVGRRVSPLAVPLHLQVASPRGQGKGGLPTTEPTRPKISTTRAISSRRSPVHGQHDAAGDMKYET